MKLHFDILVSAEFKILFGFFKIWHFAFGKVNIVTE